MAADHADVFVYTRAGCIHCEQARELLHARQIPFTEVHGDGLPGFRRTLRERTGGTSVPQITIDGTPVGGASELAWLDRRGLLEPLARRERFPRAIVRRRLNAIGLLTAPFGGTCGLWRHRVEVVGRDGRALERLPARTAGEAWELAMFLNEREGPA